jgi:hypothetical protein
MKLLAKRSVMAFIAAFSIAGAPATAQTQEDSQGKTLQFAIDGSVSYALQHVNKQGWYHSVLLSPQARFFYGKPNGSGPFIAAGDALFSTIVGGPSDAKPSGAAKVSESQVYVEAGYCFHILNPATNLTLGVGYMNQEIDTKSKKFGHGVFVGIGFAVPIFSAPLH